MHTYPAYFDACSSQCPEGRLCTRAGSLGFIAACRPQLDMNCADAKLLQSDESMNFCPIMQGPFQNRADADQQQRVARQSGEGNEPEYNDQKPGTENELKRGRRSNVE